MKRFVLGLATAAVAAFIGATAAEQESLAQPRAVTPEQCFVAADGKAGEPRDNPPDPSLIDRLFLVNKDTRDDSTRQVLIGAYEEGIDEIEAIAIDPVTLKLYAANAGQLGILDVDSARFHKLDLPIGFDDVDGLSFDPTDGKLYGTVRRDGDAHLDDLLIQIDKRTGAHVKDAFGPGRDSLTIPVTIDGDRLDDIDDLAIDLDGTMYAVANNSSGTKNDHLIIIDKGDSTDGVAAVTDVGALRKDDAAVNDIEGLGFDTSGRLWGTGGKDQLLYEIDPETATVLSLVELPLGVDYEGIDCLIDADPDRDGIPTQGEIIIGTDPLDPDTDDDCIDDGAEPDFDLDSDGDGLINALDPDADGDGVVDGTDLTGEECFAGIEFSVQGGGCSITDNDDAGWFVILMALIALGLAMGRWRRLLGVVGVSAIVASTVARPRRR